MNPVLPVGKLPPELLARLLLQTPTFDSRVLLGPGIGLDCAVVEYGEKCLVLKTDPITFATDQIGWYAVQVNSNDIATSGADPRWMLLTVLLPVGKSTAELAEEIFGQVYEACKKHEISVIGGHTEITSGIDRVIIVATMIGEVDRHKLVTPRGAQPGDSLLLTKVIPIEATALIAREFPSILRIVLTPDEVQLAENYLHDPGISILRDAKIALASGRVTAMHDPTEGGLAAALWELAEASQVSISIDADAIPIPKLSRRICQAVGLEPLASIASGALLLAVEADNAEAIRSSLIKEKILCTHIGNIGLPPVGVLIKQSSSSAGILLPRPDRDAITKLYE